MKPTDSLINPASAGSSFRTILGLMLKEEWRQNLDRANLTMADLSKSDFKGSSMNGVLDQDTIYDGANLEGINK